MSYEQNISLADYIRDGWLASMDGDGNLAPYEQYMSQELGRLGIAPGTDISGYRADYKAGGDAPGDARSLRVGQEGQAPAYSLDWEDIKQFPPLLAAAIVFGGSALGAGLAGAGAAGSGAAGAAGGAGAAGAGVAGGGTGGLLAAESGLTALGSAWSPAALGLTEAIVPAISAGELAALGSGIPGLVSAGAGASGGLAAADTGLSALGSAWSPEALGLTSMAPSTAAAEIAGLSGALPGVGGAGLAAGIETLPPVSVTGTSTPTASGGGLLGGGAAVPAASLPDLSGLGGTPLDMTQIDQILNQTPTQIPDTPGLSTSLLPDWLKNGAGSLADMVGGGKNLAGIIGAVGGALDSGGANTATTQTQIDPRMQQYLYGSGYGDQNSFLGAAQNLWQQNKTGINPTMQQGLDMQRSALQDPAYGQAYTQMRDVGTGLLGRPMAGNPFSQGGGAMPGAPGAAGGPTSQAGGVGGLLGGGLQDRAKMMMAAGRGLLG